MNNGKKCLANMRKSISLSETVSEITNSFRV